MSGVLSSILPSESFRQLPHLFGITLVLGGALHVTIRLLALILKRRKDDELLKGFPGPPRHWFWGNVREVRTTEEALPVGMKWASMYGSPRRVGVGPFLNFVVINDPESVRTVLSRGDPKEPQVYRFLEPWIGDGLLLSKGKKWARNRKLLTPGFHFEILKPYVSIFSQSANTMVNKWKMELEKSSSVEMFHHVSLMMLDSLLKCAFNYDGAVQTDGRKNIYIESVYLLAECVATRFRNPFHYNPLLFYLSYNGYRFRKACGIVHDYSRNVIKARREEKKHSEEQRTSRKYLDFLDILLEARDESGQGLTDTEIQHEVDTFMFEGHDTTASGLSWFLYNMATHPEHQEKCYQEIMEVLGDRDEVEWDDLARFEYLTLCIKESLRTHPPVPSIARKISKPITFKNGMTAPEGMWVMIGIYAMHHNPEVWEDPEKYDPLRFTAENSKGRSPHAFVPFSAGPRNCIGQNFAMYEMKASSAILLKNFKLSFSESEEPIKYPELVLRAKKGVWLNIEKRN